MQVQGALDMSGNVWEWVADRYDENYDARSPKVNPQGAADGIYRVAKGGSRYSQENYMRAANRDWFEPVKRDMYLGFRCAHSS